MNSTNETAPVQQTPEQLLRVLELQRGARREPRARSEGSRVAVLVAGIAAIVVGACLALWVLEHFARELRAPQRPVESTPVVFGQP